eukprot:360853-Chlamydomonas_euryale.AAC.11
MRGPSARVHAHLPRCELECKAAVELNQSHLQRRRSNRYWYPAVLVTRSAGNVPCVAMCRAWQCAVRGDVQYYGPQRHATHGPTQRHATHGPTQRHATHGPTQRHATHGPTQRHATHGPTQRHATHGPTQHHATN